MTNPIETAVAPIKAEAIVRAEQDARAYLGRIFEGLAAAGWDAQVYAPFPKSMNGRKAYMSGKAKYDLVRAITRSTDKRGCRRMNDPEIVAPHEAGIERFVEEAKEAAAAHYDSFVAKLIGKIGETTAATLNGSHVWGHSILTVTKADGSVERWKTQQIVNVSVLGKLFNQWPSRKVK